MRACEKSGARTTWALTRPRRAEVPPVAFVARGVLHVEPENVKEGSGGLRLCRGGLRFAGPDSKRRCGGIAARTRALCASSSAQGSLERVSTNLAPAFSNSSTTHNTARKETRADDARARLLTPSLVDRRDLSQVEREREREREDRSDARAVDERLFRGILVGFSSGFSPHFRMVGAVSAPSYSRASCS